MVGLYLCSNGLNIILNILNIILYSIQFGNTFKWEEKKYLTPTNYQSKINLLKFRNDCVKIK